MKLTSHDGSVSTLSSVQILNVQESTKITLLPICFQCLVTLSQRLWFLSIRFWRYINLFVCMIR